MKLPQQFYAIAEAMYLDYFNDYLTVEKFASDYGISIELATAVLRLGRTLNHRRASVSDVRKETLTTREREGHAWLKDLTNGERRWHKPKAKMYPWQKEILDRQDATNYSLGLNYGKCEVSRLHRNGQKPQVQFYGKSPTQLALDDAEILDALAAKRMVTNTGTPMRKSLAKEAQQIFIGLAVLTSIALMTFIIYLFNSGKI